MNNIKYMYIYSIYIVKYNYSILYTENVCINVCMSSWYERFKRDTVMDSIWRTNEFKHPQKLVNIVDTYSILSTALAGCCLSTFYHLNAGSQLPAHPTCQHTYAESNWNRSWQRLLAFQPQMHWRKQGQIFTMLTLVHCTAGDSSIFKQDMMVLTQTAGSSPPHQKCKRKEILSNSPLPNFSE